jgi:hypothetical protein
MSKYSMGSVELLREQLRLREQNLVKLELQAARHGMDVPLALQNQIDFEIQKIEELRKRLAKAEARPSAAEEEAAVPLWQRLPMWGWAAIGGVVLLIAVVGAFLAAREAKPEPTSTVIAEATTLVATSTATPQPTATPVAPTFTPLPPIDTPVPPTATPMPTNTPRPTDTPVPPTVTPVPTSTPRPKATPMPPTPVPTPSIPIYDDFEDGVIGAWYDPGWAPEEQAVSYEVYESDGALHFDIVNDTSIFRWGRFLTGQGRKLREIHMSVTLETASGGQAGLALYVSSPSHFYDLSVSVKEGIMLGSSQYPYQTIRYARCCPSTHLLGARVDGTQIHFYVDGDLVISFPEAGLLQDPGFAMGVDGRSTLNGYVDDVWIEFVE